MKAGRSGSSLSSQGFMMTVIWLRAWLVPTLGLEPVTLRT